MKKGLKTILILLLLLAIGVGAYYYFNPRKALTIIFPEVEEIQKVHIKLIKDTALIKLDFEMKNKSLFKLNIDSLSYKIALDTSVMLEKSQYLNIVLLPGKKDTISLPLALPIKKLQNEIRTLQGTDSTDIVVDLRVVYNTIWGATTLPVSRKLRIRVPKPPKIELVKTEYIKRDNKTFYVDAHIKIQNYGELDLKLSEINYKLTAEDLFTVEDKFPGNVTVKPRSHHTFVLPVKIEVKKILKTAIKVLTNNDKVSYVLKVQAILETGKMKGERTPVDLEKKGILEIKK